MCTICLCDSSLYNARQFSLVNLPFQSEGFTAVLSSLLLIMSASLAVACLLYSSHRLHLASVLATDKLRCNGPDPMWKQQHPTTPLK